MDFASLAVRALSYGATLGLCLAWSKPDAARGLAWVDRLVRRLTLRQVAAASALLAVSLSALTLTARTSPVYIDAAAYEAVARALLAGGSPYGVPGYTVPYGPLFSLEMAPFVAVFGNGGVHVALLAVTALVPPLLWLVARRHGLEPGYPAAFGLCAPWFFYVAYRWPFEEAWVVVACLVPLALLAARHERVAMASAGLLMVKFVSLVPAAAWVLLSGRDAPKGRRFRTAATLAAWVAVPFLAVQALAAWLWPSYLREIYLFPTVERGSGVPSANAFHILEVLDLSAGGWVMVFPAAATLAAFAWVTWGRHGMGPIQAGGFVLAVLMLGIPTLTPAFFTWLLPFAFLLCTTRAGPSPWLALAAMACFDVWSIGEYLPGKPRWLTLPGAALCTLLLATFAWRFAGVQGRRQPDSGQAVASGP